MNKLFVMIKSGTREGLAIHNRMRDILQTGVYAEITEAADLIYDYYKDKEEARKLALSTLRMQLRRACYSLQLPTMTVKRDKEKGFYITESKPSKRARERTTISKVVQYISHHKEDPKVVEASLDVVLGALERPDVLRAVTDRIAQIAGQEVSEAIHHRRTA